MRERFAPPAVETQVATVLPIGGARSPRGEARPWRLAEPPPPPVAEIPEHELAELRARASEEGFAEGLAAGRSAAEGELAELRARTQHAIDRMLGAAAGFDESWRRELAILAVDVAEAVLQRELAAAHTWIDGLVTQAIAALGDDGPWTVTVAPSEVEATAAAIGSRHPGATIRGDGSLAPGDVIVTGAAGRVDARIAERMATARRMVLGTDDGGGDG